MIQAKDITVAVPCAFENEDPIWMMRESCRKHGLSLRPYAMNKVYNGWTELKIYLLREEALSCPTSHILYTDAQRCVVPWRSRRDCREIQCARCAPADVIRSVRHLRHLCRFL